MTPVKMPDGVPVLVIDNMYDEVELAAIWRELDFLTSPKRMAPSEHVGAAKDANGVSKKTSTGIFLDDFYGNRSSSNILEINRKLFSEQIIKQATQLNIFYKTLINIKLDHTLINYYDSNQDYTAHIDDSVFSAITTFYKEPVQFTGGDLEFPELGIKIEKKNNRMVMFPGALEHAITPVVMHMQHPPYSGYGRYGMAQFLNIK